MNFDHQLNEDEPGQNEKLFSLPTNRKIKMKTRSLTIKI